MTVIDLVLQTLYLVHFDSLKLHILIFPLWLENIDAALINAKLHLLPSSCIYIKFISPINFKKIKVFI